MKKWRWLLMLCMLIIIDVNQGLSGGFYAYRLPDKTYGWRTLYYEKAEIKIELQGLFYQTSVQIKARLGKARKNGVECALPDAGQYELNWIFNLPDEAFITNIKMWNDETGDFIPADILQLSEAEQLYDPSSSESPQLLLREYRDRGYNGNLSHFYLLKIAPVNYNEFTEFIIQYLMPCEMFWDVRRVNATPSEFFSARTNTCENSAWFEYKIMDHDHPAQQPANLFGLTQANSWQKRDGFWRTSVTDNFSYVVLSLPAEDQNGLFLQTWQDSNLSYYQLASKPHISEADIPARHIILAFDLTQNSDEYSRNTVLSYLREPLITSTTEKDSLAFIISDFNTRWLDTDFFPCSETEIDIRFSEIKTTSPQMNTLPFMLKEIIRFLNKKNFAAEIWFISNDQSHGNPAETAMEIVQQTVLAAKNPVTFRIIDACRSANGYWISKQYYHGNEYLYENLYRLSKGTLVTLRNFNTYNWNDQILECIAPTVSSVEIDPMPSGGLCYSKVDLNRDRKNFNLTSRYFQIGLYEGETPFSLNYFGNFYNQSWYSESEMEENQAEISDEMKQWVKTYWFGNYVVNELLEQPQSYETIRYIEELSNENNILTPYSGFIIPGARGYAGFEMLAADDSVLTEKPLAIAKTNEIFPEEFSLNAFPNPFNPQTTISISLPESAKYGEAQIMIYNVLGQVVRTFNFSAAKSSATRILWDGLNEFGENVGSGAYLVIVRAGEHKRSLKILLLR